MTHIMSMDWMMLGMDSVSAAKVTVGKLLNKKADNTIFFFKIHSILSKLNNRLCSIFSSANPVDVLYV